jgi:endo-1,4-beta-xylanase
MAIAWERIAATDRTFFMATGARAGIIALACRWILNRVSTPATSDEGAAMKNVRFLTPRLAILATAAILRSVAVLQATAVVAGQAPKGATPVPPAPAALAIPQPAQATDQPYAPQPILQGGIVLPLFPPDSPYLKKERIHEAEKYNLNKDVPGRISSIVNIHNPSIEVHLVDRSLNTGSAVILVAGGGHRTLNVGSEGADFVPFFYNYGVNTVILRNRLRSDGYNARTDAVYDAQQAIRLVRAHANEWRIDPNRIGIMGFSAGAELASAAAIFYGEFDGKNKDAGDPLAGISSRPDFVGIVYPGPTPFARGAAPAIPRDVPPSFIICAGSGDQVHAVWADEYFAAMLKVSAPNVEMHIYGNGHHPGSGSTGGLTDRRGTPFGTWHYRFIDWFRDLGFLQAPGVDTKAAKDVAAYATRPTGGRGGGN